MKVDKNLIYFFSFPVPILPTWFPIRKRPVRSSIQKAIDDNILNIYKGKTKLLVSELKDSDAAVLGASALAWELKDLKE